MFPLALIGGYSFGQLAIAVVIVCIKLVLSL